MKLIEHNRDTFSLKCRGCCQSYEIPGQCQSDPESFAMFTERIEQMHKDKGCTEAAEIVQRVRYKPNDTVRTYVRPTWGEMVRAAENAR